MTNLVTMQGNQAMTSSIQIAEVFGKRHSHVLDAIEAKIRSAENSADYKSMFTESTYIDKSNRNSKNYLLNRDGFTFIAFGFTGTEADKFKLDFIKAFNAMENTIKQHIQIPKNPMEALKLMFDVQTEVKEDVNLIRTRVVDLEENVHLSATDYSHISKNVGQRVRLVIKERKLDLNNEQRRLIYRDINGSINRITGVRNRSNLRAKHYEMVYDFIQDWQPSTATLTIIKTMNRDEKHKEEIDNE